MEVKQLDNDDGNVMFSAASGNDVYVIQLNTGSTESGALKIEPYASACDRYATVLSNLPIKVTTRHPDYPELRLNINNHPLEQMLKRPNQYQTQSSFFYNIFHDLAHHRVAYIFKTGSKAKPILTVLNPNDVKFKVNEDFTVEYEFGGKVLNSKNIRRIVSTPTGTFGMDVTPTWKIAGEAISTYKLVNDHLDGFFRNGTKSATIATLKPVSENIKLDDVKKQVKRIAKQMHEKQHIVLAGFDVKVDTLSTSMKDTNSKEILDNQVVRIARAFGINAHFLEIYDGINVANSAEQARLALLETLYPKANMVAEGLTALLIEGEERIEFAGMIVKPEEFSRIQDRAIRNGTRCRDEVRAASGLAAIPDGSGKEYIDPSKHVISGSNEDNGSKSKESTEEDSTKSTEEKE